MVEDETSEKINKLIRMSTTPKTSREAENVILPQSEGPECKTGRENITPIGDGEPSFSDCSGTPHQQLEDLYITAQINRFLELTKGKRNVSLSTYFPDKAKFVKSAHHKE